MFLFIYIYIFFFLSIFKDQKGSFGLTLVQHDNTTWIQSVQPHGSADQQDIRAGDQLIQINGTPVEALKFQDIQNMLEHANSNQIHLTCVPYREPQAQPIVVNVNQAESLPTLISSKKLNLFFFSFNEEFVFFR